MKLIGDIRENGDAGEHDESPSMWSDSAQPIWAMSEKPAPQPPPNKKQKRFGKDKTDVPIPDDVQEKLIRRTTYMGLALVFLISIPAAIFAYIDEFSAPEGNENASGEVAPPAATDEDPGPMREGHSLVSESVEFDGEHYIVKGLMVDSNGQPAGGANLTYEFYDANGLLCCTITATTRSDGSYEVSTADGSIIGTPQIASFACVDSSGVNAAQATSLIENENARYIAEHAPEPEPQDPGTEEFNGEYYIWHAAPIDEPFDPPENNSLGRFENHWYIVKEGPGYYQDCIAALKPGDQIAVDDKIIVINGTSEFGRNTSYDVIMAGMPARTNVFVRYTGDYDLVVAYGQPS